MEQVIAVVVIAKDFTGSRTRVWFRVGVIGGVIRVRVRVKVIRKGCRWRMETMACERG